MRNPVLIVPCEDCFDCKHLSNNPIDKDLNLWECPLWSATYEGEQPGWSGEPICLDYYED
jgi:hypothetical protein